MPEELSEALVRDILRVLCRKDTHYGQMVLYQFALNAGESGFTSQQVKDRMDLKQDQHRGLMSALANRVNGTRRETQPSDKPGVTLLFKQKWNGSQNTYWPRPELLAAIDRLPVLRDLALQDLESIRQGTPTQFTLPEGIEPNPVVPPTPAAPEATSTELLTPFEELLAVLEGQELHYPSELVSNFLLALQTKRFVILTGISGTGKTRIAQALSKRYKATRKVVSDSSLAPDVEVVRVREYMKQHRRFALPGGVLSKSTQLMGQEGAGRIPAYTPNGEVELAIWRSPSGPSTTVYLKGSAWEWFDALRVDQPFTIRLVEEEGSPRLVLDAEVHDSEEAVDNSAIVAVRPEWTDNRGLLGYYNPITQMYMPTPFLRLLLAANAEVESAGNGRDPEPFFVILDEMNIARVEHYFSDFLSALESGDDLPLHDVADLDEMSPDPDLAVPRRLRIPENLFFIGTVNVDESTYMFSPKVLDRAFTIELNEVDLQGFSGKAPRSDELELGRWDGLLPPKRSRKPTRSDWLDFSSLLDGKLAAHVVELNAILQRENRHFGYRVANEIGRFVNLANAQATDPELAVWAALDLAILQKVLPKLHGTQRELDALLRDLMSFVLAGADGPTVVRDASKWKPDWAAGTLQHEDPTIDASPVFQRSAMKLWRMRNRLARQGFTAWIE